MRARVVLADSQALVAEGLAGVLKGELEVVELATDAAGLVRQALRHVPSLVVTDVSLAGSSGLAAAERVLRELPQTRVVFVTACDDVRTASRAFALGAAGYVLRSATSRELLRALKAVLRGERWLSPGVAGGDPEALPAHAPDLESI